MGEIIGMLAGVLTTCSFFPQVWKTIKTRSTEDMSAGWIIMMSTGVLLWIFYGVYLGSFPVIIANVVTFACLIVLAWIKFFGSTST